MKRFIALASLMLIAMVAPLATAQASGPIGYTNTGLPVYVASAPLYGFNQSLSIPTTITATSFTTIGLALPSIPAGATVHGYCHLVWQQGTAAATVSFGAGFSAAPTDAYIFSSINTAVSGASTKAYTTLTATGPTIIGAAATPGVAATNYEVTLDFVVANGASATVVTLYGLTSNGSDALVIQPGSNCGWTN